MEEITNYLLSQKDEKYKEFSAKLIPNINKNSILGVRTPVLRNYAKILLKEKTKESVCENFLKELPHTYHEENCLHGFIIEKEKDFNKAVEKLNAFLPYINNWASCDCITPKVFKNHTAELLPQINIWLKSNSVYTVRFAIKMLMTFYLDRDFNEDFLKTVQNVTLTDYYVQMMQAWYYATALAKQYNKTVAFLTNKNCTLSNFVYNKSIQKAVESFRITPEQKVYLKTLKRKTNNNKKLSFLR